MRFISLSLLFLMLLLSPPGCSREQSLPPVRLMDDVLLSTFTAEISGRRAKSYINDISGHHRILGAYENTGYEEIVDYVVEFLTDAGIENVRLQLYPSDGFKMYGTWNSRPGFRVEKAELHLVEPYRSKWGDYDLTAVPRQY